MKTTHTRKCIIPRGELVGADRRFRYKAFWCLTPREQQEVQRSYPHKAAGIPDEAYAYPIRKNGSLANASRSLMWTYEHTKRRVAKHRASRS